MNNIKDLNIEKEILPIFNYALNKFTEQKIIELLKEPLSSKNEIQYRQNIFRGYTENNGILNDYSYTALYFNDVYSFFNAFAEKDYSTNRINYYITNTKAQRAKNRSDFSLLILFFNRLYTKYFSRLKLSFFPTEYKEKIDQINNFLRAFNLELIVRNHS